MSRVASATGAGKALDFAKLFEELGLGPKVQRKPWVIISDSREALESTLGVATDELLVSMATWLQATASAPAAVGLGHVSGNVYLAPALDLKASTLSPEQTLVANLFSHGEMGADALAVREAPDGVSVDLIKELFTYRRVRWLTPGSLPLSRSKAAGAQAARGDVSSSARVRVEKTKQQSLRRHPLLCETLGDGPRGDLLQHGNFGHLDIKGDTIEELQVYAAHIAAARAYCPLGGSGLIGCAIRTSSAMIFSGSAIGTRSGNGSVSPLKTALVSLGANGGDPNDIVSVVWAAYDARAEPNLGKLMRQEEDLLSALASSATPSVAKAAALEQACL